MHLQLEDCGANPTVCDNLRNNGCDFGVGSVFSEALEKQGKRTINLTSLLCPPSQAGQQRRSTVILHS